MEDIKTKLKEAREAIKNKNYETSLKLSKAILKEDKGNYMALIFLGLSLQELGPPEQAPKAFQRAIESNPSNPLAWNGLINYYEKIDSMKAKQELIKLYSSVLSLERIEKKIIECCEKLGKLWEYGNIKEITQTIFNCRENDNVQDKYPIYEILVHLFQQINDFPSELDNMYEECLSHAIGKKEAKPEYYSAYLTLLYRKKEYNKLLIHAEKMYNLFTAETISLIWICKVFNRCFVENPEKAENMFEKLTEYYPKLLQVEPQNAIGLFSKSITLLKEEELLKAKDAVTEAVSLRPGLLHAWVLLTNIYIKLNLCEEAMESSLVAKKLLESLNNSNKILKEILNVLTIELLSKSSEEEDWKEALELYRNL